MVAETKTMPKREALISGAQILGASLFLALFSQISIPLYFSPVPITGQTVAIMLIGLSLGSRNAVLAVLAYLAEGAVGLPFFAHGHGGIAPLLGPTGGYFLGFIAQAYLVGRLSECSIPLNRALFFGGLLFACALQMAMGALWLSFFVGIGSAMSLGFYPFVIGEASKCALVAALFKK